MTKPTRRPADLDQPGHLPNQTWLMPRLIGVFAGRTGHFVGFVMQWLISDEILIYHNIIDCVAIAVF